MKPTAMILALFALPLSAEYRDWTDEKSGKKITAKPIQKSMNKDRIELRLDSGKIVWIEISRLVEEDQKFAKNWELDENLISTKVIRFGRNWKDVKVTAMGGVTGGRVVMSAYSNEEKPKVRQVKPGETSVFEFRAEETWEVEFIYNESVLDRESERNTTGKRHR